MPQTVNDTPQPPLEAPKNTRAGPNERQCAVTRERLAPSRLIRFVRSPDGTAVPDLNGKLPGRGCWITASREILEKAERDDTFSRSFKQKTKLLDNAGNMIETQLVARCTGLLGLAKKAGEVTVGFNQVRSYIRHSEPGWLLEASDGAEDGRNKVHFLAKAIYEDVRVAGALTSAELGMALGRDHVIHALLTTGRLAETFAVAYSRLTGFRLAPETGWFSGR